MTTCKPTNSPIEGRLKLYIWKIKL